MANGSLRVELMLLFVTAVAAGGTFWQGTLMKEQGELMRVALTAADRSRAIENLVISVAQLCAALNTHELGPQEAATLLSQAQVAVTVAQVRLGKDTTDNLQKQLDALKLPIVSPNVSEGRESCRKVMTVIRDWARTMQ